MANLGLEGIVGKVLISASTIGLVALSGCGYRGAQPDTTLPAPQVHVTAFAPIATTPEPTYTPTASPEPTPAPIQTETPEPTPYLTPAEACVPEKKIIVDISEQMIYAVIDSCDGSREWMRSQVSTGKPGYDTPIGEYEIWIKFLSTDMRGADYYTKDVPYTMYFTEWGHAIHGAYWHKNFGRPVSHGCVNLPLDAAEQFFYWAEEGTQVIVQP